MQEYYYINSSFSSSFANGHIMLNTPVLVRSLKLSNIEPKCMNILQFKLNNLEKKKKNKLHLRQLFSAD